MNMTTTQYPHARSYVATWKRVKAVASSSPDAQIQAFGGWFPNSAIREYAKFTKAMHARINLRGGVRFVGRKHSETYERDMRRDCWAIRDNATKRIIVRQLTTPELRRRFASILWTDE